MAKDGLDLGNDGANEGYWRVQMRSEKTGRWVRMKGPVAFDTVHPNYGPISGVGTFEGGARAGVALVKVSGGKLDGKIIEVPATDFEDIEAIIPEDAPGLEEARQLDAADGVIVNAPNLVDADSEVENRSKTREMVPVVVRDLKVGDIVQQGTPDALFGRITGARRSSDGKTSQIDVTWSDGLSYTMGLDSADMVKSWPSSSFLSKLPTKHSSTEEQIAAVQSYAHQGHSPINGYLRADAKPYREEGDGTRFVYNAWGEDYPEDRVLDEIRQLDGLIEDGPGLWGDTTLYRFIDSKRLSDEMKLLKPGAILFDKGYTSTSRGYGWRYEGPDPAEVRMVISAPAGTKALDIQWFKRQSLSSTGESEVLLPRGTTFVVDRVEGHLVYVSIVPNKQTGLFREYGDVDKNAVENTPLSELGFDPEEEITIYRGVPKGIKDINPGDWVTALPQLAKDYAGGDGEVISMKVKVKDLLSDPSSGEGGYTDEMIYRPAEVVDALKRVSEVSSYADEITGNVEDLMGLPYSEPFTEIDRNLDNQTVKEIVDLFENTDYGILKVSKVYVVKIEGRENKVNISGDIVTSTGEEVGNFMRTITRHEDGSYSIEHEILKIENKEYRGTGFGKIFSKVSEDLYRKLGISRIELNAADENGAATWAKAGYGWAEPPTDVLRKIRRFFNDTGVYDEEGDETVPGSRAYKEKNADGVQALRDIYDRFNLYELGSENYPTPLEIVNIPEIGKYILREGTEWAGVKYLNKEEPVAKPEVVDAPIEGWEKDGAVESRGESTVLTSILTDEGFKVDGSPDKPLSAVDADVVSDDHKKAVDLYTRSSLWRSINSYLRGDLEEQESSKNIEETIPLLDEAIAENGEVFEAGRVFRGQRIDRSQSGKNWAEFMDKLQPGDVYSDEAYLSTSNSSLLAAREFGIGSYGTWETVAQGTVTADAPGGNGSIFWAIDVPVGTTAFAVPDGMGYAQGVEREVILPRGSKFVIKGVRRVEQNNPDADPDAPKSYNYFVDAELLPVAVPKAVDAPIVEETEDWVEVDGVQSRGESEIFAGVLTGDKFEYGGLRRPVAMADSGNFTYEQQRALSNYTGSDFKDINDYLRTGELDEDSIYDEKTMNSELEEIDAAIAENGYVEEDATVFRGMKIKKSTVTDSGESWASVLENFKVGDVYHEKGYLSASNSPAVAHHAFASGGLPDYFETTEDVSNNAFERGTAFWAINVPEGSAALALPVNNENFDITGDEREEEVILPRGSALKIKAIRRVKQDRDDGEEAYNYYIEAELLPVRKTIESVTEEPEVIDAPPLQTWVEVDGVQKVGDAPLFDDGRLTGTEFEASDLGYLTPIPTDFSETPEEQTKALLKYTREDYDLINSMLRGESLHPKQQKRVDDLSKSIELIDKTFESQAPIEYGKTVFRGLIFYRPELATIFEKLKPGDEWTEEAYLSTSGSPLAARGFSMMRDENPSAANASNHNVKEAQGTAFWAINLPSGSKALDISEISQYGTESEILLPRGSKLKIEGIRRVRQNRKDGAEYYNYYVEANLVSEPVEVDAPIVEEAEEPVKSGPGIWGRLKLRQLKDRLKYIINDPEVVEVIEKYSDSDESIEKLIEIIEDMGLSRKASIFEPVAKLISAAEKQYKDIDPNLDTKTGIAPAAPNSDVPDTGLGTTGYVDTQEMVRSVKDSLTLSKDPSVRESAIKSLSEDGFTSPIVVLYDKETGTYSLKNPEEDSDKLIVSRDLRRLTPVVIEVNGESVNPRFYKNAPKEFRPTSPVPEDYPNVSGIPDLPVPERSQAEKDAIETYRGWNYMDVKIHMDTPYGHPDKTQEERDKLDEIVSNLDKVTSTELLPEGTVLYRGFSLRTEKDQEWYEYYSELKPGDRMLMPLRFTSTTLDRDIAESYSIMSNNKIAPEDMRSVVMKLVTVEGATGAAFENDKTVFSREKEVLLPMLANVTVTNVYKDADGVLRVEGSYGPKISETVDAPKVEVVPSKSEGESDALDSIFVNGTVDLIGLRSPFSPVKTEDISAEGYKSLSTYAGFDYASINGYLRGLGLEPLESDNQEGALERRLEDVQKHISNIDLAIQEAGKLDEPATVFRGIRLTDELLDKYEKLAPGEILRDEGYLSTTMRPDYAEVFSESDYASRGLLVINIPAESRALALPTSLTDAEEEVLLPRGTELKVRAIRRTESVDKSGVTRYKYYVEADVVPVDATKVEEPIEDDAEEKLREALEGLENYIPRDEPAPEIEEIQDTTPGGVTHTFNGKEFYFSPEELEKARYYISKNYLGARDVTDEEGRAFNEEMRALTDYLRPDSVSDETIAKQEELLGPGTEIKVGELRHSAPPSRFDEIMQDGIRPKITDKVGTEKYSRRRFGVFLANDYTSSEAGKLAEVFRVKVPESDLRVDSGYTPYGQNLYVERTIKPEEIEHLGHIPIDTPEYEIEVNNFGLHDGRGPECPICNPELAPAESETVEAGDVEEVPASRTISTVAELVENHEELLSRIEEIEKSSESKVEKGDVPMRALVEMLGKGGKPEMVDPSVLAGREIFYRGGPGFAIDSLKYSATDRIGLGVYGNGYYFSNLTETAEVYSAMGPGGMDAGDVVSVVWKPTAKVYSLDDLDIKLSPGYNIKMYLYTIANEAKERALEELNFPDKMTDAQRAIYKLFFSDQDVDAFTTTLILDGYDGLSFTFEGKHRVQEKYTIVFNREALQIADI